MVAEQKEDNRTEQETRQEYVASSERWAPEGGSGFLDPVVARPPACPNHLEGIFFQQICRWH